ncbi:MAG: discoidin domain-containing protein [Candidatus Hydrogenedentota bacterium]
MTKLGGLTAIWPVLAVLGLGLTVGLSAAADDLDEALEALPAWETGDDPEPMERLDDLVLEAADDPEASAELEAEFIQVLEDETTWEAKAAACRHLKLVGTENAAPALAALLDHSIVGPRARDTLEDIGGSAAEEALLAALEDASGNQLIGLLHTLGRLGVAEAVEPAADHAVNAEPGEARLAAVNALNRIDTEAARDHIRDLYENADEAPRATAANAYLALAGRLHDEGHVENARDMFWNVYDSGDSASARAAALRGYAETAEEEALDELLENLWEGAERLHAAARMSLLEVGGESFTLALVERLGDLEPEQRAILIEILGSRADAVAGEVIFAESDSEHEGVRDAALAALAQAGRASDAPALVERAAAAEGEEADLLREALLEIPDPETNAALIDAYADAPSDQQALIIATLAGRQASEALEPALEWVEDEEPAVRAAAAELLGALGDDAALDALANAARDEEAEVRAAAMDALGQWPSPAPLETLRELIPQLEEEAEREAAVEGAVNLLALPSGRSPTETAGRYGEALEWTEDTQLKERILDELAELRSETAAEVARAYLEHEELGEKAEDTVGQIEQALDAPASADASANSGDVSNALDGNPDTRWTSGSPQDGGEWFLLDLGEPQAIQAIVLNTSGSGNDYPRGYEVHAGNNRDALDEHLVLEGEGDGPITRLELNGTEARFVRITQTGSAEGNYWSIHTLTIERAE